MQEVFFRGQQQLIPGRDVQLACSTTILFRKDHWRNVLVKGIQITAMKKKPVCDLFLQKRLDDCKNTFEYTRLIYYVNSLYSNGESILGGCRRRGVPAGPGEAAQ